MKKVGIPLLWSYLELFNEEVTESAISDIDTYSRNPLSLLFQTGYLTIKSFDREDDAYRLGIPTRNIQSWKIVNSD